MESGCPFCDRIESIEPVAAAGQTIDHAHLHVIPRYTGDVSDPRGGIRLVIPERARYWSE